ncbi:unnamed protein product [Diplocarpon coronariae]
MSFTQRGSSVRWGDAPVLAKRCVGCQSPPPSSVQEEEGGGGTRKQGRGRGAVARRPRYSHRAHGHLAAARLESLISLPAGPGPWSKGGDPLDGGRAARTSRHAPSIPLRRVEADVPLPPSLSIICHLSSVMHHSAQELVVPFGPGKNVRCSPPHIRAAEVLSLSLSLSLTHSLSLSPSAVAGTRGCAGARHRTDDWSRDGHVRETRNPPGASLGGERVVPRPRMWRPSFSPLLLVRARGPAIGYRSTRFTDPVIARDLEDT